MDKKFVYGIIFGFILGSLLIHFVNLPQPVKHQDTHQEEFLETLPKMGE